MKLHVLSDIHLEFGKWPKSVDVNTIDADVTILAGDIGVGLEGLQWALTINRPVIYIMGNHEFYGQRPMNELWRKAREKIEGTHIHLLENTSILIDDPRNPSERVRFIGATLWTDFCLLGTEHQEESMKHAARTITDYDAIYVSRRGKSLVESGYSAKHQGDRLTPRKTLSLHHESRDYLERELARVPDPKAPIDPWNKTVVVTHFAPHRGCVAPQHQGSELAPYFVTDLAWMMEKHRIDVWCHGHTHTNNDFEAENGCRVVSNQRGYASELAIGGMGFRPDLVIEV